MSTIDYWRGQSPNLALLHSDQRKIEERRDLESADEAIVMKLGQSVEQIEIASHSSRPQEGSDDENYLSHLLLGGQLTSPEGWTRHGMESLAIALGSLIDEYDIRGSLRRRSTLPRSIGIAIMRINRQAVCLGKGALGNRRCKRWTPRALALHQDPDWEATCQQCHRPVAPLEMVAKTLFPGTPPSQRNGKEKVSLVSALHPDHIRHVLGGARALQVSTAIHAIDRLRKKYPDPIAGEIADLLTQHLDFYNHLPPALIRITKSLKDRWDKTLDLSQSLVATWTSDRSEVTWKYVDADIDDPIRPVDSAIYPTVGDVEDFGRVGSRSFHRPVRSFQHIPASYEIRITTYPLPIDGVAGKDARAQWAVRLLVRPLSGA